MNMSETIDTMGREMKDTGRSVWLAGLGAASSLQDAGTSVFETLVERGRARKEKGFNLPSPLRQATEEAGDRVKDLGQQVESRVEEGVTSTMKRLGVPVRQDFEQLIERIERLTVQVDRLANTK